MAAVLPIDPLKVSARVARGDSGRTRFPDRLARARPAHARRGVAGGSGPARCQRLDRGRDAYLVQASLARYQSGVFQDCESTPHRPQRICRNWDWRRRTRAISGWTRTCAAARRRMRRGQIASPPVLHGRDALSPSTSDNPGRTLAILHADLDGQARQRRVPGLANFARQSGRPDETRPRGDGAEFARAPCLHIGVAKMAGTHGLLQASLAGGGVSGFLETRRAAAPGVGVDHAGGLLDGFRRIRHRLPGGRHRNAAAPAAVPRL